MKLEARYKIGNEVVGPRPLDDIRRDIGSGALASSTPIQLTADGLWTTLDGVEKKLDRFKKPSMGRSRPGTFIIANLILLTGGYFAPWICFLAAVGLYLVGVMRRFFEEGRQYPSIAIARLITSLFPFFVHLVGGPPCSPSVRWLFASAFAQFAAFCAYVQLDR